MKLYYHPVSTTSRVVAAVRRWTRASRSTTRSSTCSPASTCKPEFAQINPNCLVPVLEDGDFRLTESSAILKYLADKAGSPAYPKDLKKRARVNEMMDWLNTDFYRTSATA